MHKDTLWFIVAILCIYFSLVLCEKSYETQELLPMEPTSDLLKSDSTDLIEEARTRRHRHHLYSRWGFYGLAIAYLIKLKVVVVAFIVGAAVWFGFRYIWPHKCGSEIYKEGGIILDHPPSFANHDHIPYSLDHDHSDHYSDHHHFDTSFWGNSGPSNFEPYSAYSGSSYGAAVASDAPPSTVSAETHTFRRKRDTNGEESHEEDNEDDNVQVEESKESFRQVATTEEQIGNFMFSFLGLDSAACRRRFICEMEFRSKANPLTAMAFRVLGRSFFGKYTNDRNELGKAGSFEDCAAVNSECVFIENENTEEPDEDTTEEPGHANAEEVPQMSNIDSVKDEEELLPTEETSLESNNIVENENILNIKAELRNNSYRRRVRGDRHLKTE